MASLSAADLQRKHALEGAPDPFPSLGDNEELKVKHSSASTVASLDTESQTAFPSLAPSAPARQTAAAAWSTTATPRIKGAATKSNLVSDSFNLNSVDLSHAGKDGKPGTLGDVMKNIMTRFKVKVEASTQRKTGQTTFFIKGESGREVEKSKRQLVALLSSVVTLTVNAPASTIATIIGPKGAALKQIRDETNVRIDIPRKDSLVPNGTNGHLNGTSQPTTRSATPLVADGDEEEPMVPVTIQGPAPFAEEARSRILAIVATKTSKTTQRVRDIPQHLISFVLARKPQFEAAAQGEEVHLSWVEKDREVIVYGDREAVGRVIERVKATVEELKTGLQLITIQLPKRQHRLLVGNSNQEIFRKSRCAVVVPKPEEAGEDVKIWGLPADVPTGLQAVMEAANSQHIHEYPLPGPATLSRQLLTYINKTSYAKTLSSEHPGITVYPPSSIPQDKQGSVNIDLVGDKALVDAAVKKLSEVIAKLIGGTRDVEIDWLLHRVIQGKSAKKLKQFYEVHNVISYFPPEFAESSTVVLVYDPLSPSASPLPSEKAKHLDEVDKELKKLAKDAADVKKETLIVDKKWHGAIIGHGGTTLNAIIGEDKALAIKLGHDANKLVNGDVDDENLIVIRGASGDVDRASKEIRRIVEEAKNDEIDNSHSVEFEIGREYVGKIVGAHGSGVNKLREQLGVRLDFNDEPDDKEKEGKKKKAPAQKSKVKITGRKENVEEAKRRILGHVEKLADETSEILRIPRQYHSSIIGQSGKYVMRLEDKYSVKITFPRDSDEHAEAGKSRENLKTDEVLVKGGKKGVAGAKAEIMDAVEFEKESNNTLKFTVPTRAVARILGKGGASINEIKNETDAQIDIDKASEDASPFANVTLRGTKKSIAAAKAAIMAIADSVGDEITVTVTIESKFHRSLIGAGGQGLRDLVAKCGGPADTKVQAGLIHFPRQGEPTDEVRLRGERGLVAKLQVELEKTAAALRDRVVLGVSVPAAQHRAMIGRGGQNLNDLQGRTGTQVQFPGSRSYQQVGEPENAADLKEADPQNIVKVLGPRSAVEKAVAEIAKQIRAPAPDTLKATVEVPLRYHHVISQQGAFFRNLRAFGVTVDQSTTPTKSAVPARPYADAPTARIDDADVEADTASIQWQVIANYQDAEEGNSEWSLRAKDQPALDKAKTLIKEAIEHAEKASHVGFLILPDRSVFPRIVGSKGANVARLRQETGAEITVGREDNLITILGSEPAIQAAKDALLQIAEAKNRRN
ncbi:SCP160 protein [Ramaria rubella]|nr:SCP160 protein [Ramaria rubella]